MRVTKAMKEHTIKELDAARNAANKADAAEYNRRQEECKKEIKLYLDSIVNPTIHELLAKYGMDTTALKYGDLIPSAEAILPLYDSYISNRAEGNALRDRAQKRYEEQGAMVEDFILQCDLGADKEQFFAMIEDMKKKMAAL